MEDRRSSGRAIIGGARNVSSSPPAFGDDRSMVFPCLTAMAISENNHMVAIMGNEDDVILDSLLRKSTEVNEPTLDFGKLFTPCYEYGQASIELFSFSIANMGVVEFLVLTSSSQHIRQLSVPALTSSPRHMRRVLVEYSLSSSYDIGRCARDPKTPILPPPLLFSDQARKLMPPSLPSSWSAQARGAEVPLYPSLLYSYEARPKLYPEFPLFGSQETRQLVYPLFVASSVRASKRSRTALISCGEHRTSTTGKMPITGGSNWQYEPPENRRQHKPPVQNRRYKTAGTCFLHDFFRRLEYRRKAAGNT
ncbi:hypothetical protein MA16_Dca004701 [Dendrobium catenatum]|uniref:Uncharacterized protein n=1 Tax=Dendrobium catenatum TaxID=906689 RepID=A0A2I0VNU5_9ASPA|nr:hypothetical protein MA16_Dca004701 [Dendrobium catenatum]